TAWNATVNNTVRAVVLDASAGLVYVGGLFTTVGAGGSTRNRIAAISIVTAIAAPWNPNADSTVFALAFDAANDRVVFAGSFVSVDVTDRQNVAVTARATTTDPDLAATSA